MKLSINDKQSKQTLSRTSSASSLSSRSVRQNTAQTISSQAINLYAPLLGQAQSAAVYHMNRADELVGQVINESSRADMMANIASNESSRADMMANIASNESSRADYNAYIASSLLQENLILKQHLEKSNIQQPNVQSVPVNRHATDDTHIAIQDTQNPRLTEEQRKERNNKKKEKLKKDKAEKQKQKNAAIIIQNFFKEYKNKATEAKKIVPTEQFALLSIESVPTQLQNFKTAPVTIRKTDTNETGHTTGEQVAVVRNNKNKKSKNKKIKNKKADDDFDFDTLIAQNKNEIKKFQAQEKEQILALLQTDKDALDKNIYKKFKKIRKELPLMEALSIQNDRGNTLLHNITAQTSDDVHNFVLVSEIFKDLSTEEAISCLKMTNNKKRTPMEYMFFIWDFKTIDISLEKMNDTQIKDLIHGTDQQVNRLTEMLVKYGEDMVSKKYDTEFIDTFGDFCNEIIGNYDRYRAKSR